MLASCLCLTMASRAAFLPQALACFHTQDWQDKELVIVADSDCDLSAVGEGVAVVLVEPGTSIGAKRNLGCQMARGRFIVHFDDDDYSAPDRVSDQVTRLMQTGKCVTSYRNLRFTDGETVWINRNWPGGYGTSQAYRRSWWERFPFPEMQIGEDWDFVSAAMRSGEYVAADAQQRMLCRIHPGNTAPPQVGANWERV